MDGTGRLQAVDVERNSPYHQLIDAVRRWSGVGTVLNINFNEDKTVVDTTKQALDGFRRTEMASLCLGRSMLRMRPSPMPDTGTAH